MFKCCYSDRKAQIFWINKAHFADVARSYIEKMQRSIAKKDGFAGRIIIFKHTLMSFLQKKINDDISQKTNDEPIISSKKRGTSFKFLLKTV